MLGRKTVGCSERTFRWVGRGTLVGCLGDLSWEEACIIRSEDGEELGEEWSIQERWKGLCKGLRQRTEHFQGKERNG